MSTNLLVISAPNRFGWLTSGTPLERATRFLAVLTGFSIPLSTSFSEITTGLYMACWVCSGNWRAKWAVIRANTVALWSLALFGLLLAGVTWSVESWSSAGRCLLKYREFVYVPMFLVVFRDAALRRIAVSAFMLAAVILLGLSYYEWLTGADFGISSNPRDYVIAKDHIIHSLIMAFVVYLAAGRLAENLGRIRPESRRAWGWVALYATIIAVTIYNELCMLTGRTGYVVLAALVCLFLAERMGRRGLMMATVLLAASAWAAVNFSTLIRARVDQTIRQLQNQLGPERKHSPDPRMEFYANTLEMIARHPWLGTGTGSFRREYARHVADKDDVATSDPHNEYLHLASQVGIPGAVLFMSLLAFQWFAAARLPATERSIGRGVVATIALGSLFNSLIMSITGGLIYSYFSALAFAELMPTSQSTAAPEASPGAVGPTVPIQTKRAAA